MELKPDNLNFQKKFIDIDSLLTTFYFEFTKDYYFSGERHNFWEMVYVDKGPIEVSADHIGYKLMDGDVIFHKPNEFHQIWGDGINAPIVVIITFICNSPAMGFFENRITTTTSVERKLIANYLKEAHNVFKGSLGILVDGANRLDSPRDGSEQLMYIYLEQFLIRLIRAENRQINYIRESEMTIHRFDSSLVNHVIEFMLDNLDKNIKLKEIANKFFLSETRLKNLFKQQTSSSIMTYYKNLKIEEAKKIIREEETTITRISEILGFDSVHNFSNHFKKFTGMSPSQYRHSIEALEKSLKKPEDP